METSEDLQRRILAIKSITPVRVTGQRRKELRESKSLLGEANSVWNDANALNKILWMRNFGKTMKDGFIERSIAIIEDRIKELKS